MWGLSWSQAPTSPKSLALAKTSLLGALLPKRVITPDIPIMSTVQMLSHGHDPATPIDDSQGTPLPFTLIKGKEKEQLQEYFMSATYTQPTEETQELTQRSIPSYTAVSTSSWQGTIGNITGAPPAGGSTSTSAHNVTNPVATTYPMIARTSIDMLSITITGTGSGTSGAYATTSGTTGANPSPSSVSSNSTSGTQIGGARELG